jgi:hypothetical protein
MIVCKGKNRDDTPCKRKAPDDIGFCCKHASLSLLPLVEGQGFICGYKGCVVLTATKEHCAKCKALQEKDVVGEPDGAGAAGGAASATPGAPVESLPDADSAAVVKADDQAGEEDPTEETMMTTTPVCDYCSGKPAHDNTKYCADCAAKLEKELGLVDEGDEKKADCNGRL